MPQRKPWTPEEDKILKYLREDLQISKWSSISKTMADEYEMPGRTGKQCRERYHNHLDSTILRTEWTEDEEKYLYALHDEIGNKWAIIAQKLPGRTDNCVKNHFYSKMRKSLRKLNKVIHNNFRKEFKEIKMIVLYKIVEATDEKFKINPNVDEEVSEKCCKIKNLLLEYSNDDDNNLEGDLQKLRETIAEIYQFSSRYRRRPKRNRRGSMQATDLLSIPKFEHKIKSSSDRGSEMESDEEYSIVFSHDQEDDDSLEIGQKSQKKEERDLQFIEEEEDHEKGGNLLLEPPTIRINRGRRNTYSCPKQVQDALKDEGLLIESHIEDNFFFRPPAMLLGKNSIKSDESESVGEKVAENMLSESIERMKIGQLHFNLDSEQIDDDHKLFVNT